MMSTDENPYAPPRSADVAFGVKSGRREDLKTIALAQKSIFVCILLQILGFTAQFAAPLEYRLPILIAIMAVNIIAVASVLLLAIKVYNVVTGVILCLGAMVPCISLLVLLVVNSKTTSILQQNGHRVGLLGADLSEF
jgi:hypothetical protein